MVSHYWLRDQFDTGRPDNPLRLPTDPFEIELIIWVFGESFGGIFAPGLSWLTGAPGAVLFYCFAGVLIALPDRHWRSPRLGRTVLGLIGLFFVGMALLQGWPGRGFWQGGTSTNPGSLASFVQDMSQSRQPHWLSSTVTSFGGFDISHGLGGRPEITNVASPNFTLVDPYGRKVSLAGLRGKTVAVTFFDPACALKANNCNTVQELRLVEGMLGARAHQVELIAINSNPRYAVRAQRCPRPVRCARR